MRTRSSMFLKYQVKLTRLEMPPPASSRIRRNVLEDLLGLPRRVAFADERATGVEPDLTGDEQQRCAGRDDRDLRVIAHRRRYALRIPELDAHSISPPCGPHATNLARETDPIFPP